MTVSGVTHRSYFQRDLLISTVVTFGHPETGNYIDRSYFQRDLLISTMVTFSHPETGYYTEHLKNLSQISSVFSDLLWKTLFFTLPYWLMFQRYTRDH